MPDYSDEALVEAPAKAKAAKAADAGAAAKKSKKKKATKAARRTQIGTLRLQVATALLAPSYNSATGGVGPARLEAALKAAGELIELNAKMPLPSAKGSKEGKEGQEAKAAKEPKVRAA
jgi:hypothetical protein